MTDNLDSNLNNFLKTIGLSPLFNDNYYAPIIARLAGYYLNNNFLFASDVDKEEFNMDVTTIGFLNGVMDIRLRM